MAEPEPEPELASSAAANEVGADQLAGTSSIEHTSGDVSEGGLAAAAAGGKTEVSTGAGMWGKYRGKLSRQADVASSTAAARRQFARAGRDEFEHK